MPTVTVLAPDSALAMEEVIRQLGDNAYILSTTTRDGQIEILATNEPNHIQPPRKRTTSVNFSDVLSEQVRQGAGLSVTFKSNRASLERAKETEPQPQPEAPQGATVVSMESARARLSETAPMTATEGIKADTTPATATGRSRPLNGQPEPSIAPRLSPTPTVAQMPSSMFFSTTSKCKAGDRWDPIEPKPDSSTVHGEPQRDVMLFEGATDLRQTLLHLGKQLIQLEAQMEQSERQCNHARAPIDPLVAAGFSAEIVQRLSPAPATPESVRLFTAALSRTLVSADPMASLRAPVIVIVGPSGGGKTVLAAKIAALRVDLQPTCAVRLVSLFKTPRFDSNALPLLARMLSVPHRGLKSDHLDADQWRDAAQTHVVDTNLDSETIQRVLQDLQETMGRDGVSLLVALPLGSSLGRIKAELEKYQAFNPTIVLTKLDEFELTPQEASQIAETGTKIAWLSGTRALTETIAPASEEMMNKFLTGLLSVQS